MTFVICTVVKFALDAASGHHHNVDLPLVGKLLASGAAKGLARLAACAFVDDLPRKVQAVGGVRRCPGVECHLGDEELGLFERVSFMGVALDAVEAAEFVL